MLPLPWAKRSKEVDSGGEATFHPLLLHMIDVASVTKALWNLVLGPDLQESLSKVTGLEKEAIGKWLSFWAGLHDLGKASPDFQGKWEEARTWLHTAGYRFQSHRISPPHGFITAATLEELLKSLSISSRLALPLARTLGGHHGVFPRSGDLTEISREARGKGAWETCRQDLFQELARYCDVLNLPAPQNDPGHAFFITLAGLVSVADWIGSNERYFPYTGQEVALEDYLRTIPKKVERALEDLGWLGWQSPKVSKSMSELFPFIRDRGLRPLQEATVQVGEKLPGAGLVILEAPMGEGKTEAAMYLADRWAAALGQKGCYFALPTVATSNQMFSRVREYLKHRYPENLVNLQLLHGHASLSAEFQALRHQADRIFTPGDIETEEDRSPGQPVAEVIAAEWFTHRKRGLLAPYGVGTVDQGLLGVLKTKHYFVRLFGLSHKTVLVDEVHAYDAYMTKLLERLLEWLAALQCSVVLLSATLPSQRRRALLEAFARGLGSLPDLKLPEVTPYPRLTWVTPSGSGSEPFEASPQFSRILQVKWVEGQVPTSEKTGLSLGEHLKDALKEGGCAAVICNTVRRAQEIYSALKPYFPGIVAGDGWPELDLFHARYLFEGREEREVRTLLRFGKPGGQVEAGERNFREVKRPHRAVLVATQVIEQSLDLDFDLLVTEMAPTDLILQRAGRLQRHDRPRPENLKEPSIWIMAPDMEARVPAFGPGTEAVYNHHILLRSWLALQGRETIAIPGEVEELIEAVYGEGPPPNSLGPEMSRAWDNSWEELVRSQGHEESQARYRYILPPYYPDDFFEDLNPELEEEDPAVHQSLQAATRLGDVTVQVICLNEVDGRVFLDADGKNPVNLDEKPDGGTTRALLRRSVALSHRGLAPWLIKQGVKPPRWLKHPLLCRHRLIVLNKDQRWQNDTYELRLDTELGVEINRLIKELR